MSASKRRSWFVESETTLAAVLAKLGEEARAVSEGRVFIGRTRARDANMRLAAGTRVDVTLGEVKARANVVELGRTEDWIAVHKPAGIPTIADQAGAAHALHELVARHLRCDASRVHPTSRLDRDVSGVVVFALTERGRDALSTAREEGAYARRYVAIAKPSHALPAEGSWDAPIGRGATPLLRAANGADAKAARSRYRVFVCAAPLAGLFVYPQTGRTHQIRVHASHAGAPLLGDAAYGGARTVTTSAGKVVALDRILLHANEVQVLGERYVAAVPPIFGSVWSQVTGTPWPTDPELDKLDAVT